MRTRALVLKTLGRKHTIGELRRDVDAGMRLMAKAILNVEPIFESRMRPILMQVEPEKKLIAGRKVERNSEHLQKDLHTEFKEIENRLKSAKETDVITNAASAFFTAIGVFGIYGAITQAQEKVFYVMTAIAGIIGLIGIHMLTRHGLELHLEKTKRIISEFPSKYEEAIDRWVGRTDREIKSI